MGTETKKRPRGQTFGGAQFPRIADDKLIEMVVEFGGERVLFDLAVAQLVRVKNGGTLSDKERDHWLHIARDLKLLAPRKCKQRPREKLSAHDPDSFSAAHTDGTDAAMAHLSAWARPGGKMPQPPGRSR